MVAITMLKWADVQYSCVMHGMYVQQCYGSNQYQNQRSP